MRETWLSKELVVEPDLRVLQRHPRPLLFHREQAHRSTLAHHVARPARLGPWVLTNGSWYKRSSQAILRCTKISGIRRASNDGRSFGPAHQTRITAKNREHRTKGSFAGPC